MTEQEWKDRYRERFMAMLDADGLSETSARQIVDGQIEAAWSEEEPSSPSDPAAMAEATYYGLADQE